MEEWIALQLTPGWAGESIIQDRWYEDRLSAMLQLTPGWAGESIAAEQRLEALWTEQLQLTPGWAGESISARRTGSLIHRAAASVDPRLGRGIHPFGTMGRGQEMQTPLQLTPGWAGESIAGIGPMMDWALQQASVDPRLGRGIHRSAGPARRSPD